MRPTAERGSGDGGLTTGMMRVTFDVINAVRYYWGGVDGRVVPRCGDPERLGAPSEPQVRSRRTADGVAEAGLSQCGGESRRSGGATGESTGEVEGLAVRA